MCLLFYRGKKKPPHGLFGQPSIFKKWLILESYKIRPEKIFVTYLELPGVTVFPNGRKLLDFRCQPTQK